MNEQQVKLITELASPNAAYNAEWDIFLKRDIDWPPERTIALIGPTVYEFQFDVDDASPPTCKVNQVHVFVGEE